MLPLFIYTSAFVLYHDDKGQFDLNDYCLKFLVEPTVFLLVLLVVMNTVVDLWVYRNPKKAIFKIGLMLLNFAYLLWMIIRGFFLSGGVETHVISGILLVVMMYKLFRYHEYYQLYKQSI